MEKRKMKVWKILLLVLAILLVLFIIDTGRKMFIIKDLQNKVSQYTNQTNYYMKSYEYQGPIITISETYKKDNRDLTSITNVSEERIMRLTNFKKDDRVTTYIDIPNDKIAIVNSDAIPAEFKVMDWLYTENTWQFIVRSIKSSIQTEECNGKECYKIQVGCFELFCFDDHKEDLDYFEKETGLLVRRKNGTIGINNEKTDSIVDYYYEFGTVTDEHLKEPNISEYKIQENN